MKTFLKIQFLLLFIGFFFNCNKPLELPFNSSLLNLLKEPNKTKSSKANTNLEEQIKLFDGIEAKKERFPFEVPDPNFKLKYYGFSDQIQIAYIANSRVNNLNDGSISYKVKFSKNGSNQRIIDITYKKGTFLSKVDWNNIASEQIYSLDGITPSLNQFPSEASNPVFNLNDYNIGKIKQVKINYISGSKESNKNDGTISYKVKISRTGLNDRTVNVTYKKGSFISELQWNSITGDKIYSFDGISPSLNKYSSDASNPNFTSNSYKVSGISNVKIAYVNGSRINKNGTLFYKVKISRTGLSDRVVNVAYLSKSFRHRPLSVKTLNGHSHFVRSAVFSPNGKIVASGSKDNTIKLWNASNSTLISTLTGHSNSVNSVAFSPNGDKIASGSKDNTIKLWNVSNSTIISTLTGHSNSVNSVAFSPNGDKIASGSKDNTIKLWNVSNSTIISTLTGHSNSVNSVAFSPNGDKIASSSYDGTIKIWNVLNGILIKTINLSNRNYRYHHRGGNRRDEWDRWQRYEVSSIDFSPDGNKIVVGIEDEIKVWDVSNGTLLKTLGSNNKRYHHRNGRDRENYHDGHSDFISSVKFSPDGSRIVSGSYDETIKIWNTSSGNLIKTLGEDNKRYHHRGSDNINTSYGHFDLISSIDFSPDGNKIISSSYDKTVKIWEYFE